MDALFRRYEIRLVTALAVAASGAAWAQAPQSAGRFITVTGQVSVLGRDGVSRPAERGGDIREGDTIITGDSALAQARMSDGGLISVRPDSEFKLEQFGYKGRDDRSASFVVSILKGGFRTITGLIAQVNRPGYKINTPAATIGVRGTHFEVVHVPQLAAPQVPPGTYNRVFEGITTVQNPAGNVLQVMREQTAFASLQGGNIVLVAPPAVIFGRPTPVPRASIPQDKDRAHKEAIKGEDRSLKMGDRGFKTDRGLKRGDAPVVSERPTPALRDATPLTPLDSTTTLRSVPISPIETTTIQVAPTTTIKLDSTSTILSPTTTTISPTTTTISPTLSTSPILSPTTTTISPTTTTISPTLSTTTTISPTLSTTISPTTTTTTTSPTTSTILQSPTTTTTTTIIKR
jgi:hypothetical protein